MINELLDFLKQRKKTNLFMVAVNIAVLLAMYLTGGDPQDVSYLWAHGAMYPGDILTGAKYYPLFTSMFLHFGAEHLLLNMLLLLFAGDMLEERVGAARYLLIYLGGGLAGNLLSLGVSAMTGSYAVSAGASGAVFAVIGALLWIVVGDKERAKGINGRGLCAMAVLNLAQGFWETGVDNRAHLGGFIGGFVLAAITGIVSSRGRKRKA